MLAVARQMKAVNDAKRALTNKNKGEPDLDELILNRDYSGAITVLEFYKHANKTHPKYQTNPWIAYCAFHLGDYEKAIGIYREMIAHDKKDTLVHLYIACCLFFMGQYKEVLSHVDQGPDCDLQHRLRFHVADKLQDEPMVAKCYEKMQHNPINQLSLASMHFTNNRTQEAVDIYKKILLDDSSCDAIHFYLAVCYHKLDYYDISNEVLASYLQKHPTSPFAVNLKSCNQYKLFQGKLAEQVLQPIIDLQNSSHSVENYLIKHNLVVFRGGSNALQVLPSLIDIIPEARLNLVIYHLKNGEIQQAYDLIKDLEPMRPQEFTLKGVVNACVGQLNESKEHLKRAQQYFQLIGASSTECDTIPGRQCMASCYFIMKRFEDVLVYLKSIKTFFVADDDFNWNYGIALAAAGKFKEGEEAFLQIQNEQYKQDYCYISWLARCFIMNSKPMKAWELYLKIDTSRDCLTLLTLIANDCYRAGSFYVACKAFDVLERLDPNPEYWDGKRGSAVGVFQLIIAGKEDPSILVDIVNMLKNTNNQEVEYILRVIKKWAKENKVSVM
ncbi:intraflagellar transport protein 56 [Acrasis kona]|uniref:Intraflagellar transport protein 56 n=1 Tax=Acrasis kona TaxID=1008807 RepID=A0AAW2Z622_9EUKA